MDSVDDTLMATERLLHALEEDRTLYEQKTFLERLKEIRMQQKETTEYLCRLYEEERRHSGQKENSTQHPTPHHCPKVSIQNGTSRPPPPTMHEQVRLFLLTQENLSLPFITKRTTLTAWILRLNAHPFTSQKITPLLANSNIFPICLNHPFHGMCPFVNTQKDTHKEAQKDQLKMG
ncbi:unnamed protein product [Nippostrongylus brasiliensis]|uniref:CUPID domain-containing protein n=1 Tax=Nippostrongylus brasiliensis TaxID=27835 RepID=A0A0N4XDA5_NIPBR|nr:unnamed protein product [Nippostrongylus brasiliensis]